MPARSVVFVPALVPREDDRLETPPTIIRLRDVLFWEGTTLQFDQTNIEAQLAAVAPEVRKAFSESLEADASRALASARGNEAQLRGMQHLLIDWRRRLKPRVGVAYENLSAMGPARDEQHGIVIGRW